MEEGEGEGAEEGEGGEVTLKVALTEEEIRQAKWDLIHEDPTLSGWYQWMREQEAKGPEHMRGMKWQKTTSRFFSRLRSLLELKLERLAKGKAAATKAAAAEAGVVPAPRPGVTFPPPRPQRKRKSR